MCIYRQNSTIFISSILAIYYIRHNYKFRPLMLAIFRLYMNLSSSLQHVWGVFFRVTRSRPPHKITPSPHPKKHPTHAVLLLDNFMYNPKMANISHRNM